GPAPMPVETDVPEGFEALPRYNPFGTLTGPLYEMRQDDGSWVRGFRVEEKHTNRMKVAHGGMLMNFADMVLGCAVMDQNHGGFVTIRMTTDFVSPALLGSWVEGSAEVQDVDNGVFTVKGEITSRGKTVLNISGLFKAVTPKVIAS
ncbi:MAG: PaaI family thioesterase, partial [Sphingomonadales bacterium]|nr:PaaI family thioesterase [Sphingomonadales bacterium]